MQERIVVEVRAELDSVIERVENCVQRSAAGGASDFVKAADVNHLVVFLFAKVLSQSVHAKIPRNAIVTAKGDDTSTGFLSKVLILSNIAANPIRFTSYVAIMRSYFGTHPDNLVAVLCKRAHRGRNNFAIGNDVSKCVFIKGVDDENGNITTSTAISFRRSQVMHFLPDFLQRLFTTSGDADTQFSKIIPSQVVGSHTTSKTSGAKENDVEFTWSHLGRRSILTRYHILGTLTLLLLATGHDTHHARHPKP
mmetsp:Transcript_6529/g.18494  ORF Transcript_6529/g.18494 Transcript_6529/m.18494 type:complete len:252 (+) Transcript_6529:1100-1855(+)